MVNLNQNDDIDPDLNYFDEIISENHVFTTFNSMGDFYTMNPIPMNDNNHLSIIGQNIRSLNANLDSFLLLFNNEIMPDIFVFSETWKDTYDPIVIPGYVGHHTVRHGRSGGVSVFIKSHLNSEIISNFSYADNSIEICTVKVTNGSSCMYIFGIYRPVSGDISNFTHTLESILSHRSFFNQKCALIGDFNANMLSFGNDGNIDRLVDMMQSHHYMQVISDVTRRGTNSDNNPSIIDLIWINQFTNYNAAVIKTGITDHFTLIIQLPFLCDKNSTEKIKITFRDCSLNFHENFENDLMNFPWNSLKNNDIDVFTNNFVSTLNAIFQKCFPVRTKYVTVKYFANPWYSPELKKTC